MHNLREIKEQVMEEGFLELKVTRVDISWDIVKDGLMVYGDIYVPQRNGCFAGYYIDVHQCLKKAGIAEMRGGIAHEYSHIIKDIQQTRKEARRKTRKYNHSEAYCRKDEIRTDLEAINRGFGYDLLALEIFRKAHFNYKALCIPSSHLKRILAIRRDLPGGFTYRDYINIFGNGENGRNKR